MSISIDEPQTDLELHFPDQDEVVKAHGIDASGSLFKKYFLETGLPQIEEFKKIYNDDQTLRNFYDDLLSWCGSLSLEGGDDEVESEVRKELIDPLLKHYLGFPTKTERLVPERFGKSEGKIDYVLYKNEGLRARSQNKADVFLEALALLEAKRWKKDLDNEDPSRKQSPERQLLNYLGNLDHSNKTSVEWGVLSNGNEWRIYSLKEIHSSKYFAIDFTPIIEEEISFEESKPALALFLLFFNKEAFISPVATKDQSFLDKCFEEGKNYEEKVHENIKDQVFTEVFPNLATGIFEELKNSSVDLRNKKYPEITQPSDQIIEDYLSDEGDRLEYDRLMAIIRRSANILMFRILFLIYAEDRNLLPMDNENYREDFSFKKTQVEIEERYSAGGSFTSKSKKLWSSLYRLFELMNEGSPREHNLPVYNGGLFDPRKHPLLEKIKISDQYMAEAVDHLARNFEGGKYNKQEAKRINYQDLNEQHLGNLYEGLLEYRVDVTKRETKVELTGETRARGQLIWESSNEERKGTGSYYTPDFIVKYIVENTIGKQIEEIKENFYSKAEQLQQNDATWVEIVKQLQGHDPAEKILELKVLDPAMGSGHFLIEAVNVLSSSIEEMISIPFDEPDSEENRMYFSPLHEQISCERENILEGLEKQGLNWKEFSGKIGLGNLIRRMVLKRCVFGVDINPLAVELCKLSLWLNSFTIGAPLSFLDHHLRVGNSLVGSNFEELQKVVEESTGATKQVGMGFENTFLEVVNQAVSHLLNVSSGHDATQEQINYSQEEYQSATRTLLPYKKVLDLLLLEKFGFEEGKKLIQKNFQEARKFIENSQGYLEKQDHLIENKRKAGNISKKNYKKEKKRLEKLETIKNKSAALYTNHRFFHWDLEFPEIYFREDGEQKDNPGFDVIIGNPPWASVRGKYGSKMLNKTEISYLEKSFPENTYMPNLYEYFVNKSLEIIKVGGRHSFIVPDRLGFNSNLEYIRVKMLNKFHLENLVYKVPFPNIIADTLVYVLRNENNDKRNYAIYVSEYGNEPIKIKSDFYKNTGDTAFLYFDNSKVIEVIKKLDKNNIELGEVAETTSGFGGKSHKITETRINNEQTPVLKGRDIARYCIKDNHWFEFEQENITGRTRDPSKLGEKPKIIIRKTGSELPAAYENKGIFPEQSLYFVYNIKCGYNAHNLLALLNSKIFSFVYRNKLVTNRDSTPQLKNMHLDSFRLPPIKEENKERAGKLGKTVKNMIPLKNEEIKLSKALNPFKYFSRDCSLSQFREVFSEEIKYGQLLNCHIEPDIVRHDVDGLKLITEGDTTKLFVQLKKRDPEDWRNFLKDGYNIVREWVPIYKFNDLDEKKRVFYEEAFQVLEDFEGFTSFPGGYTKETIKKLHKTPIPEFTPETDLQDMIELKQEILEAEEKIVALDNQIDQILYRLYDLTAEEIQIVEESFEKD